MTDHNVCQHIAHTVVQHQHERHPQTMSRHNKYPPSITGTETRCFNDASMSLQISFASSDLSVLSM